LLLGSPKCAVHIRATRCRNAGPGWCSLATGICLCSLATGICLCLQVDTCSHEDISLQQKMLLQQANPFSCHSKRAGELLLSGALMFNIASILHIAFVLRDGLLIHMEAAEVGKPWTSNDVKGTSCIRDSTSLHGRDVFSVVNTSGCVMKRPGGNVSLLPVVVSQSHCTHVTITLY
jgi:hypothetical protein